jgi:hypothetical protein
MQLLKCFIYSGTSLLKVLIIMVVLDMLSSLLSSVAISASVCRDQSIELYLDFSPPGLLKTMQCFDVIFCPDISVLVFFFKHSSLFVPLH